ncbi:hypothetical protein MIDIC_410004 [Alphaproteobacteria bacterium]
MVSGGYVAGYKKNVALFQFGSSFFIKKNEFGQELGTGAKKELATACPGLKEESLQEC